MSVSDNGIYQFSGTSLSGGYTMSSFVKTLAPGIDEAIAELDAIKTELEANPSDPALAAKLNYANQEYATRVNMLNQYIRNVGNLGKTLIQNSGV